MEPTAETKEKLESSSNQNVDQHASRHLSDNQLNFNKQSVNNWPIAG